MQNYPKQKKKFPKQSEKQQGRKYADYYLFLMKKRKRQKNECFEQISEP